MVPTWQCFMKLVPPLAQEPANPWCFRGQSARWNLTTTFERLAKNLDVTDREEMRNLEWRLCREFQRSYATVATTSPPADHDYLATDGACEDQFVAAQGACTQLTEEAAAVMRSCFPEVDDWSDSP